MASLALIASMACSHHSLEKNLTLSDILLRLLVNHVNLDRHPVGERNAATQQHPSLVPFRLAQGERRRLVVDLDLAVGHPGLARAALALPATERDRVAVAFERFE